MASDQIEFRRAQRKIIDFAIDRLFIKNEKGAAIFAKLGSGKTLAALEVFNQMRALGEARRALVVAPVRPLTRTWPNEIKQWGYDFNYARINGKLINPTHYAIVFCTPDSLHHAIPMAEQKAFDLIIVDESQRFQSFTNDRIKNMKKILPHIRNRVIMTATPRANKMTQLFSQIYIVDDGEALGKNATICRNKFCDRGGYKGHDFIFRKECEDMVAKLIAPMSVYLNEEDIDFDYPELIVNDIICPMDDETRRHQATLKQELYVALNNGETLTVGSAGAAYNSLKQLAQGFLYGPEKKIIHLHSAKLDALETIANENSGQVLIFYWYAANLQRIVKKLGAKNCCVPAGKSDKLANKEIDKWMDHKKQFMPAQIASMGEGLNLQAPDHEVLIEFEIPDSATMHLQGIGRLQRPGGAKHIFLHRILLEDSIEQVQVERLNGRLTTQDEFLCSLKTWASQ